MNNNEINKKKNHFLNHCRNKVNHFKQIFQFLTGAVNTRIFILKSFDYQRDNCKFLNGKLWPQREVRKLLKYHGDENVLYMPIVLKEWEVQRRRVAKCTRMYKKMTVDGKNNNWKSHCS